MTAWPDPVLPGDRSASRREVKRLSRRFAGVGVGIPPERLHQIVAGGSATDDELVDITFALTATQLLTEQRRTKHGRAQRRCVHGLIVFAAMLIAINVLLCLGLALFVLTQHTSPY
ncbi:hypothetical protein ACXDF8_07785 [Mycolicibacterium sp. CBM1]